MREVEALKDKKQIEKMKKHLSGNPRDLLLFTMGINVGLRISDLLSLKVKDVVGASLILTEQKTGKSRMIELNKTVRDGVAAYLQAAKIQNPDEYLFRSRKGTNRPIGRVEAWQILNDAAARARINAAVGTHTLRKTFGYWAYKQGIDITLLQQIFNHSSPKVTLRYIGITQDDIKNVYMNLNL